MKLRLEHGLLYTTVVVIHHGRRAEFSDIIVDTGSVGSVFDADRLIDAGISNEGTDLIGEIVGIGGTEAVLYKRVDRVIVSEFEIEQFAIAVGNVNYGFPIGGILGLNFLTRVGAVIDLATLDMTQSAYFNSSGSN